MSERWVKVATRSEVPEGGTLLVAVAGEPVCLYNIDGTIYATHDICSHEEASLAEGFVDGDCIECPLHQALFHIPTGKARSAPATEDIRVYPVDVRDDDVLVDAGEGAA